MMRLQDFIGYFSNMQLNLVPKEVSVTGLEACFSSIDTMRRNYIQIDQLQQALQN
jgi:hypothetical protein